MSKYQDMQQSHWVCYEYPDKSYYYGQVGYLDQSGVVQSKDNNEAANNPKNKLVKHGFGIYIYNVNEKGQASRYQGNWDRDMKNGQGKLTVPGQFSYEGIFRQGNYHQSGKMQWTNGDVYEGGWKRNRMQGGGVFKHHDGFVLKGSFKANFFIDEGILRNPQMSEKQYILFKKQRKQVIKQKQRNQKVKHGFVVKVGVNQNEEIHKLCEKSNKNNRIPLLLASAQSQINLQKLKQKLSEFKKVNEFDLRKAYKLQGQQKFNYKNNFKQITKKALKNGQILLINLDESQIQFNQIFYPDFKQFYDSNGFNNTTFSRDIMKRKQVYQKITGQSISDDYQIIIWSKLKYSEQIQEQKIYQKLQIRLENILPFIKIDVVFLKK